MLIFLFKGKIMITPLKYKPTVLKITENAANALRKRHDDDTIAFALEIIRTNRTINTPVRMPKNLLDHIKNLFSSKSQMIVTLDEERGTFFLNVLTKINGLQFSGKNVPVNMKDIMMRRGAVDEALLKSKEEILKKIKFYDGERKYLEV